MLAERTDENSKGRDARVAGPRVRTRTSVQLGLPSRVPPSRGGPTEPSCLSEGSLAVLFPNQSPHLPSTPVSRLLEKLRVPTAVFTADLKLSITQPASLVCPSILSPVEGAGLGATLPALFCLPQASIFLTPGQQTPPVLSCLASSSALMDVSRWMGPNLPGPRLPPSSHPYSDAPVAHPHLAGPNPRARSPELRDRVCPVPRAFQKAISPSPASWEPSTGFPVCGRSPCSGKGEATSPRVPLCSKHWKRVTRFPFHHCLVEQELLPLPSSRR